MIKTAQEFLQLRNSSNPDEYNRSVTEEATEEVWLELIHEYPEMKVWVVHNKTIPLSILEILSDDYDVDVRYTVASKKKLNYALFEKMSKDTDESIRERIAYNKKVPLNILKKLVSDTSDVVRAVALEKLQARS